MKKVKKRTIKRLAVDLEQELFASLDIMPLPDESIIFRSVLVKQLANDNWAIIHINSRDIIDQFFLRTTALLAADAYSRLNLSDLKTIKRLDNQYWSHHWDTILMSTNIKFIKNYSKYLVALNKFENSQIKKQFFGDQIVKRFRSTFFH